MTFTSNGGAHVGETHSSPWGYYATCDHPHPGSAIRWTSQTYVPTSQDAYALWTDHVRAHVKVDVFGKPFHGRILGYDGDGAVVFVPTLNQTVIVARDELTERTDALVHPFPTH